VSTYQVQLDVFEGPLDLLLRLIEREELDITLVSLALVADQFLAHIARLPDASAASLADFLAIGARLLVLKSRVLLPRPENEAASEEEDWGQDLVERLQEYRRYKEAAARLRAIEEANPHVPAGSAAPADRAAPAPRRGFGRRAVCRLARHLGGAAAQPAGGYGGGAHGRAHRRLCAHHPGADGAPGPRAL
jgi:segregation and condensation protein A